MDRRAALTAFDEQIRRNPAPDGRVEHDHGVVRRGRVDGVTWSELVVVVVDADAVIAAQVSRFAGLSGAWEWKHYSYDQPPDRPSRLLAAGFTPETLLVAEIADLELDVAGARGRGAAAVVDEEGVDALVAVHDEVFGVDHSSLGRVLLERLRRAGRSRSRP